MGMEVKTVKRGDVRVLVIEIELEKKPTPSKTGNSLLVANTGGFTKTEATFDKKPIKINLCAIIAKD